jgi:TonB family protein
MKNRKHDIERYLSGGLSSAEMHALEKEALNDPFLAEALEGIEEVGRDTFLYDLHKVNRSVHNRTHKRHTIRMWAWPVGIAATVLLIAVSGFLVVTLLREQQVRQLALEQSQEKINADTDQDSLTVDSAGGIASLERSKKEIAAKQEVPALPKTPDTTTPRRKTETVPKETNPSTEVVTGEERLTENVSESEEVAKRLDAEDAIAVVDAPQSQATAQEAAAREEQAKATGDARALAETKSRAARSESTTGAIARELAPDSLVIRGKVFSAEDGEALPGVNVVVKGTNTGAVTDVNGNYQIRIPHESINLVFNFIGFTTREVSVAGQPELNVELSEDMASLSEVVVIGYGSTGSSTERATYTPARPQVSASGFKDYLNQAVKYPAEALKNKTEGKATVRFTVEPSGQLTDFEIVRGIGSGCDEELIRAIREGPSWKPARQGDRPVRDRVKVRYRFEL